MSRREAPDAPLAPGGATIPLTARATPESLPQRLIRRLVHHLTHRFVLTRRKTVESYAAGFRFTVPPTVFHPSVFKTGEYFAEFIGGLDLRGQRVADVGTGSGILALAAARAGASQVIALDINPNAAWAANANARINGLGDRIAGVCSNLLSSLAARPLFDVIVSNPPYFAGEPRDLADRAWHSGPSHRDIVELFVQARERLAPGGRMYALFSARADLGLLRALIEQANFRVRLASERSILIDTFVIYELDAG
jgi:methylase of polypeptide subunit release factors